MATRRTASLGYRDDPPAKSISVESRRGLDWFSFFVADVQTGFGPFLSVYLTTQKWTQADIGLILSIGSLASLVGQMPGGWIVDRASSKRRAATIALVVIGISAFVMAVWPVFGMMVAAKLLHVGGSCVLGPAIAAITLGLVGHAAAGQRLGRNARFASIGNGMTAGLMGAIGYLISPQAVFYVTAALVLPAVLALHRIKEHEIDRTAADGGVAVGTVDRSAQGFASVMRLVKRPSLLAFIACILLFHLANAAMLPLVAATLTIRSTQWATAMVAACIIVPQILVALISPSVGRLAQSWGRRPILLIGFCALPLRGALLAWTNDPYLLVVIQMLDGISAAVLGVLVPLTLADVSRGTGRFNLAQGITGSAIGIGATLSTALAGYLADRLGDSATFLSLATIALCALATLAFVMPETKPKES